MSGKRNYVFEDLSVNIPTEKNIAVLGNNGAGKSTFLRMLGGIESPDSGSIDTDLSISWPLGLSTGIQLSMTGRENTDFVCRIYGIENVKEAHEFILDFSELGAKYDELVSGYSSGMRSRLSFSLSILFKFDILILDEIISVGDAKFKAKSKSAIEELNKSGSKIILVSHSMKAVESMCDTSLVINNGQMHFFETTKEGINFLKRINGEKNK